MQATSSLEVGQVAPEFRLKGPGGQFVTLSEYRGQRSVVLVFYPLAFSGVCSHQLPATEKFAQRFADAGAVLFGVSVDSHWSNTEFAKKLNLSFPLLSDFKRETSTAYGVFLPEQGYSQRAVFVIDRQGVVAYKDVAPNVNDMDQIPSNERILEALERLK